MHTDLPTLNRHFGIEDVLSFSAGEGGLWRALITTDKCTAEIYRHGAHLTRWRPDGHDEVLWMSAKSNFLYDMPIRGGVPICFPWFGGNKPASDPQGPSHGYARIRTWEFIEARQEQDGMTLVLRNTIEPFETKFAVTVGDKLKMKLTVTNASKTTATFEAALHTYFTVSQIRGVSVHGLENADYIDTVGGGRREMKQDHNPITFTAETDRTYASTATVRIDDPGLSRSITIEKTGSNSTVVWNPWVDKSKAMSDFGDEEWPGMLCVETANCGANAVTLEPGATHEMTAVISLARRSK